MIAVYIGALILMFAAIMGIVFFVVYMSDEGE